MKLMKRALALLLCFLILTNGPISAFATEGVSDNDVVVEITTTTEEVCEECGGSDAHTETCSLNTINLMNNDTQVACTVCGTVGCESTHEAWCDTCKKDNCGLTHTAPTVATGSAISGEVLGCTECGATEGHSTDCSQYVDPNACAECKQVDGHAETCSQYKAPVEACEHCGIELTDGAVHLDTCLTLCTCEPVEGVHQEGCKFYVAPVEEVADNSPQIGDKIWIKHNSYVYKSQSAENGHKLLLNYEVEIVNIITDENGNALWYEFAFTTTGIGEWLIREYKYVQAENTSVEEPEPSEPVDENACNCGENVPENIADHADSCPRKQYIKTLFENRTADEIYVEWETYDEATQTDLLNMLKVYDSTKYEELEYMINGDDDSSGLDIVYVHYTGKAANGVGAKILAPEGSFSDGTTVSISNANVSPSEVASVISEDILGIVAVDINFGGSEPANEVMVSLDIPANEVPAAANKLIVVHMSDSGPEVVGEKYLNTADSGETIAFKTDSFSSYAAVFVNGKYNAQKMSSVLQGNSRYQISTINVDLFDYDPVKINNALNAATSDGNGFHFTGFGITGMGSNNGINNSASTHAKQGILQSILQNGFPVINHLNGTNAGVTSGKILFDDSYTFDGKTIYNDIPFEFVYDSQTGYYEYKSSANHAQLNDAGNRIELYADSLSTENNYVATLDLSTANGTSDMSSKTATTNSFKATVTKSGEEDVRLDPYVLFTVDSVAASDVGQIYIKAKVPASVGANQFQIFFNTATEANTYIHDYTANGDWIEFVIDTADITNWSGTISSLRVDLFDSNKGSVDVNGSYPIEIAQISLIKKNYDAYATRGGFYPFSEIQDSYPGNNYGFNYSIWEDLFLDDSLTMARASRSIFNPAPSSETLRYEELAFGTVLEFDFYLPVDKTGLDGKDLTYYFNGDDDLWVFVDNELVLDIGGGHGAVTGSVNFSDGTWNVENANTVTGYDSGADGTYGSKSGTLSTQLSSAGKHTMKIFYLERGGSVSNCFMKFNLPRTPQGSVVVSKEVSEKNNANTAELMAAEFEFLISIQNNGTGDYQEKTPLANTEYFVIDTDGTSVNKRTDESGKFTLKSGQEAYFNIDENYNVTVEETKKELTDHAWISTTVNDTTAFSLTQLTVDGQEKRFDFVNIYERLYGDLIISKTGISPLDHNSEETQSTIYVISGTSTNGETVYLEVAIVGNGQKVIKHIPTGTYTVTEKDNWSWRYEPESNAHSVTVTGGETATTEFKNDRTEIYWLSGDSYCENWWGNNGNVIRKDEDE